MSTPMGLLTHFNQEEPFDLSQKPPGLPGLRLSQSDGESVPGSSCQEEDEESLYRRSQYSPEVDQQELEETGQRSPAELSPEDEHKQPRRQSSDEQTCERESGAEEDSADPEGARVHVLQSEETSGMMSDLDLRDQLCYHETARLRGYDSDSDSDLEVRHPELGEPGQSRAERNQSKTKANSDTTEAEFTAFTGPQCAEETK